MFKRVEIPTIYTVEKNDTLYSIAKRFDLDPNTIISINKLNNNVLHIGQKLYLVDPFKTPIHIGMDICDTQEVVDDAISKIDKYDTYIVVKGDSLYSIAKKYNTDVGRLKYINDLHNDILLIGQKLKVPNQTNKSKQSNQSRQRYN